MIDDYLMALRHRLRIPADRIIAEVEDHLRETAAVYGEADAIARFGSPEGVARKFHLEARQRATRQGLRMLVITGVALVVGYLAVDVVQPRNPWPDRHMPLALQWKLMLGGMFGLVAVAFGVAAIWQRIRDDRDTALRLALGSVIAAIPAVGFHIAFQVERLSRVDHETWFTTLVAVSAVLRLGLVAAAVALIAGVNRRLRATA